MGRRGVHGIVHCCLLLLLSCMGGTRRVAGRHVHACIGCLLSLLGLHGLSLVLLLLRRSLLRDGFCLLLLLSSWCG